MNPGDFHERLGRSRERLGRSSIGVRVGGRSWGFAGIPESLRDEMSRRWGPFACDDRDGWDVRIEVRDAGDGQWLPPPAAGEALRLEVVPGTSPPALVSYSFGLFLRPGAAAVLAMSREPRESAPRVLDNAARLLVARSAVEEGGLAFHGAGVLRDRRSWIFLGPSRAGKSTAVRLSSPAPSLGDDFALVVRRGDGWHAAAVPFDNAERIEFDRPTQTVPLGRVCRLFQAPETRLERLEGPRAVASLLSCVAFPWALPDLAGAMTDAAEALVRSDLFRHLHFSPDPGFWESLHADGGTT